MDKDAKTLGLAIGLPVGTLIAIIAITVMCCCCLKVTKDPDTGAKRVKCRKSVANFTCCMRRSKKV